MYKRRERYMCRKERRVGEGGERKKKEEDTASNGPPSPYVIVRVPP